MSKQKKWITYVCITAILCSTLIGCSSKKQTTVDKQASPTPKVLVSDEDKNSNLGQWGRAMGSVLICDQRRQRILFRWIRTDGWQSESGRCDLAKELEYFKSQTVDQPNV